MSKEQRQEWFDSLSSKEQAEYIKGKQKQKRAKRAKKPVQERQRYYITMKTLSLIHI